MMLTYGEAERVAQAFINARHGLGKAVSLREQTIGRPYGWIFYYQSAQFIATNDPLTMLLGVQPFLVSNSDGQITEKEPRETVQHFLARFKQTLQRREAIRGASCAN